MDLGAAADREACLRRVAHEAAARSARAGSDGGGFERNLDRNVDRVATIIEARDGGVEDIVGDARRERETGSGDGAGSLDLADGETTGGIEERFRRRRHPEPSA